MKSKNVTDEKILVSVYNSLGDIILKDEMYPLNGELNSRINLSGHSSGIYLMKTDFGSGSNTSRIILQKFIQRELIRISGEIIGDAYEDSTDVFDLLDVAESKLFEITNNESDSFVSVSSIQNKQGYNSIRRSLSNQYSTSNYTPDIQIVNANLKGNRELELQFSSVNGSRLNYSNTSKVVAHIEKLWGYNVTLN
mgnify:CR=1 FL=1